MTRRKKLFAASIVLILGFGLSWPLRRSEPLRPPPLRTEPSASVQTLSRPFALNDPRLPQAQEAASALTAPSGTARDPFAEAAAVTDAPFSTVSSHVDPAPPAFDADPRVHVVHQGDSLDRLAARYLGDESRAIEIFDLNREVLQNPHLLPIGAELRLPPVPEPAAE